MKIDIPRDLMRQAAARLAADTAPPPRASTTPSGPLGIASWPVDGAGRVHPQREAEFWQARDDGSVDCTLCYRQCQIADGEAGWCKVRSNQDGVLRIPAHGIITNAQPVVLHYFWWRQHAKVAWFSGSGCTSHCSFCTSTRIAWAPEQLEWLPGREQSFGNGQWAYHRAYVHPRGAVTCARQWGCSGVYLGANEPLLDAEWSIDVARLAKRERLYVNVDTNGFSSVEAVRKLAPHVDMVNVGIKGHADAEFYARRMKAEGAVPHVLASAQAWQAAGVQTAVSDVIAPPHWMPEARASEAMRRLYGWIAETLGPLTPLQLNGMIRPQIEYGDWYQPLLPPHATDADVIARTERRLLAESIARASGLEYVYSHATREVHCHHCGQVLIGKIGWVAFDLHVTDSRCDWCGGEVPVVAISRAEYARLQQEEGPSQVAHAGPARGVIEADPSRVSGVR